MPKPIQVATFYFIAASAAVGITTMYVLHEIQRAKRKIFNKKKR